MCERFKTRIERIVFWFVLWTLSLTIATCVSVWLLRDRRPALWTSIAKHVYASVVLLCGGLTHIVVECSWQLLIIIIVVLLLKRSKEESISKFDSVVESVIHFIDRSKYGTGDVTTAAQDKDTVPPPSPSNSEENGDGNENGGESISGSERCRPTGVVFESRVFKKLQDEEQRFIKRDVRIFNSNIVFDGAIEKDGHIIAVEVKASTNADCIKRYIEEVDRFYRTLPDKQRARFSLLLCLPCNRKIDDIMNEFLRKCTVPTRWRYFTDE